MSELFNDQPRIKPVWEVIPQFFRYPFKPNVLPTLIFISLASVLTLIPFLGILVWLLLWAMLFKASYEILASTASGELDGPPSVTQMSGGIMFKHVGLLLSMAVAYGFIVGTTGSPAIAIALGIFLLLALPAAIMTLAMTQSLIAALNPVTWIRIIQTTGLAYLLTSVFLMLMLLSQGQAEALLLPILGEQWILFSIISWFISAYFMAASFHLMGYLLYQFHETLGIDAIQPDDSGTDRRSGGSPLIDEARSMIKAGRSDDAVAFLRDEINQRGAELPVQNFYRDLLRSQGEHDALVEQGKNLIPVLIHSYQQPETALDTAEECLKLDSRFSIANPDDVLPLARLAFEQGRHNLVLRLTSNFGKAHGQHPDLVENYFLAAQSMAKTEGRFGKAATLVQKLKQRFPDHPLQEQIARFEATLGKTAQG